MNDITKKTLPEYFQTKKSQNIAAKDAICHCVNDFGTVENLDAKIVIHDLLAAYKNITPLETAILALDIDSTLAEIAEILLNEFPSLTSLKIGKILLDPNVYPNTSSSDMSTVLLNIGFLSNNVQATIKILYPVYFSVYANKSWQATDIVIDSSHKTTISYVQGDWTFNPDYSACDGNGGGIYSANSKDYTLSKAPEGALIGRIGNTVFLVGNFVVVPSNLSGKLELCINDDIKSRHGAGLNDNSGFLKIKITTE